MFAPVFSSMNVRQVRFLLELPIFPLCPDLREDGVHISYRVS